MENKAIIENAFYGRGHFIMDEEIILEKYQDIWQELYQEYAYAFEDYEEFKSIIKIFLNKFLKDYSDNNLTREHYLNGAKKYLRNLIHNYLKDNKISILLNYININIDPNKDAQEEIEKLIKWFKILYYTPVPNVIIDLIEKSSILKELLAKLIEPNLAKIKKYGLNKVFDNDLIVLFSEIYCTLNNIDLEEPTTDLIKSIDDSEEVMSINDILKEQQDILSSYEENHDGQSKAYYPKEKISEELPDYMPTGVDAFISEIRRKDLEVLTKEEEYVLLTKIKQGDQDAYKYFYEHNCRLVISIAKRYRNSRVDYEDLLQEGCIGLMTAIERFEVERGLKFSTYATWWIKQAILRALNKYGRKTGISINKNSDLTQYRKNVERLADELGRKPTDKEIAEHFALPLAEVQENNQLLLADYSINQSVNAEETEELGDFIKDESIKVESDTITHNLADELQNLFKQAGLTEQEILVLNYRWGLDDYEEKTLSDVGKLFGFTRERARQYEAKAIKKLRKYAGTKDFALYLDDPDKAIERLKKLATWHFNNPQSYIIYDIDISDIKIDTKQSSKEVTISAKKKKNKNYLYKVLKQYKKDDIDAVIATLSDEEKKILEIRNEYFNNPTIYSAWNNESVKKAYNNILSKIHYRLNSPEKKIKSSTIYDLAFCRNYSKEEIELAINMLEYQDYEIIKLRYGEDLDNPVTSDEWDFKKYGDIFYEEVIPHIINNLKLIQAQNIEIEEKIMTLIADEEINPDVKDIYIKALNLLKLPEIKLLLQEFSSKEKLVFALYLVKYFEGIEFNIEDFMDIIIINKEGLNECIKRSLLFMKEHLEEFAIIKNKLYYDEEKKLSRK